jgi:hypothetical protein
VISNKKIISSLHFIKIILTINPEFDLFLVRKNIPFPETTYFQAKKNITTRSSD